jgi:hypothetical protein
MSTAKPLISTAKPLISTAKLLSQENIHQLSKGRRFYRIFHDSISPKAFPSTFNNDSAAHPWRFSPFLIGPQHTIIQGLYFADTPSACMRETIFRKEKTGVLPLSEVHERQCIEVELKSTLTVYLLTGQLLKETLGFDPILNNDYPVCLSVAKLLVSKFPQLQGILFPSYQTDANTMNLVVFDHATDLSNFKFKTSSRDYLLSPRYRCDLLIAACAADKELSSGVRDICLGVAKLEG